MDPPCAQIYTYKNKVLPLSHYQNSATPMDARTESKSERSPPPRNFFLLLFLPVEAFLLRFLLIVGLFTIYRPFCYFFSMCGPFCFVFLLMRGLFATLFFMWGPFCYVFYLWGPFGYFSLHVGSLFSLYGDIF